MAYNNNIYNKFENRAQTAVKQHSELTVDDLEDFDLYTLAQANAEYAYRELIRSTHLVYKTTLDGMQ